MQAIKARNRRRMAMLAAILVIVAGLFLAALLLSGNDKDDSSGQKADRTDDGPDYQVNLSENAKNSVSGATPPADVSPPVAGEDVSEEEAAHLARQAASQLAQTNTAIANQAMQKAVDLFT